VSLPAAAADVPGANGMWTGWRGNPQHTGYQKLPGRILQPSILWKFRLGADVGGSFIRTTTGTMDIMVASTSTGLAAYTLDDTPLWTVKDMPSLSLVGAWDLTGDGRQNLLVIDQYPTPSLLVFDAATGAQVTGVDVPGTPASIKVADVDDDGVLDVVWAPAASSHVAAYSFVGGAARTIWDVEITDYISDPYTPSGMVIGSFNGRRAIYIAGARGQVPLTVLDGATGATISRRKFEFGDHFSEGGGAGQLVTLKEDSSGPRVIIVADYHSDQTYMFQGAISINANNPSDAAVIETYPNGLHYVEGSVGDFDGDGSLEILVSHYETSTTHHNLLLLDASTLNVRATIFNFYLTAIVPRGNHTWSIVGMTDVTSEHPPAFGTLAGFTMTGATPGNISYAVPNASIPPYAHSCCEDPTTDYAGNHAITFGGRLLIQRDADGISVPTEFALLDLDSGAIVNRYQAGKGIELNVLIGPGSFAPTDPLLVLRKDGWIATLSPSLSEQTRRAVTSYVLNRTDNGHVDEIAAVADLDGTGKPQILVLDSAARLLKLDLTGATLQHEPAATSIWASGVDQEILAIPGHKGSSLAVRGYKKGVPTLSLIDGNGTMKWEHPFTDTHATLMPAGMNWLALSPSVPLAIVASGGLTTASPRMTYAIDARDGRQVCSSPVGTFWDATFAVADFDDNAFGEVTFNYDIEKGAVLRLDTCEQITDSTQLPPHSFLGSVDYNGAPVIAAMDDDFVYVLNNEDNAHMALFRYLRSNPQAAELVWSVEQPALDDERNSAAAVAPLDDSWIAVVGSRSGDVRARRGTDGSLLWSVPLNSSLTSVVSCDIDGDGLADFIVGTGDGWLYALNARDGSIKWRIDLGGPAGPPIAADIDGDHATEILIPAGGYLYAIGEGRRRASAGTLP